MKDILIRIESEVAKMPKIAKKVQDAQFAELVREAKIKSEMEKIPLRKGHGRIISDYHRKKRKKIFEKHGKDWKTGAELLNMRPVSWQQYCQRHFMG